MIRALTFLLGLFGATPGHAQTDDLCRQVTHRDQPFTVCTANLSDHRIDLHLTGEDGGILGPSLRWSSPSAPSSSP